MKILHALAPYVHLVPRALRHCYCQKVAGSHRNIRTSPGCTPGFDRARSCTCRERYRFSVLRDANERGDKIARRGRVLCHFGIYARVVSRVSQRIDDNSDALDRSADVMIKMKVRIYGGARERGTNVGRLVNTARCNNRGKAAGGLERAQRRHNSRARRR